MHSREPASYPQLLYLGLPNEVTLKVIKSWWTAMHVHQSLKHSGEPCDIEKVLLHSD